MSSVVISGDISGSVTLDAPSVAGTTVLTLPATSGTVLTQNPSAPANSLVVAASGNVGIGTTSPSNKLDVTGVKANADNDSLGQMIVRDTTAYNGSPIAGIQFALKYNTAGSYVVGTSIQGFKENTTDGNFSQALRFTTQGNGDSPRERMRIDSSGNVFVNQTATSAGADGKFSVTGTSGSGLPAGTFKSFDGASQATLIAYNAGTTGNNQFMLFGTETSYTTRGSINYNRGAGLTAYNTTSDQRLKENIVDASSALSKINSVKVRSFDWKETGNHVDFGVIAQELIDVAPECVTEGDNNDEIETTWQVDTSALVPALVKAIQEQTQIINDLKARIETLEAK